MEELFDVIAVSLTTSKIRIFGQNKTARNAEAIINMAVMRRGCDEEFYTEAPAGKYKEGDTFNRSSPNA
jgi:hypothetical protein